MAWQCRDVRTGRAATVSTWLDHQVFTAVVLMSGGVGELKLAIPSEVSGIKCPRPGTGKDTPASSQPHFGSARLVIINGANAAGKVAETTPAAMKLLRRTGRSILILQGGATNQTTTCCLSMLIEKRVAIVRVLLQGSSCFRSLRQLRAPVYAERRKIIPPPAAIQPFLVLPMQIDSTTSRPFDYRASPFLIPRVA